MPESWKIPMSRPAYVLIALVWISACADDVAGPAPQTSVRPAAAVSAEQITVVMSGLNSPRGLDWGPEGGLYVVEAGTTALNGACIQFMEGTTLTMKCWSGTGSVSRLWHGRQERIVTGLPSYFITLSNFPGGPQDISFAGGRAFVTLGWGGDPGDRTLLDAAAEAAGSLIQLTPSGEWRVIADLAGFEATDNPDGSIVDSNPYGLLAEPSRRFVADAGGNSILEIEPNGSIHLLATLPSTPAPPPFNQAESVPTRVRRGPDGALYVSTLTGVPFLAGAAAIYRLGAGYTPEVYAGGFKAITDFVFAPDGGMYVLQYATGFLFFNEPGSLIHVAPEGTRTVVVEGLTQPTGLLLGPDGSIYISNRGTSVGTGEVLRIVP
jgi:hypothetical protein